MSLSFVDSDSKGRRSPPAGRDRGGPDIAAALPRSVGESSSTCHGSCGPRAISKTSTRWTRPAGRTDPPELRPLHAQRRAREMTDAVMERTRALRAGGAEVWPQVPRAGLDTRVVFDGSALLFAGMPAWVEMSQAAGAAKAALLTDPAWRERARQDWESPVFTLFPKHELSSCS